MLLFSRLSDRIPYLGTGRAAGRVTRKPYLKRQCRQGVLRFPPADDIYCACLNPWEATLLMASMLLHTAGRRYEGHTIPFGKRCVKSNSFTIDEDQRNIRFSNWNPFCQVFDSGCFLQGISTGLIVGTVLIIRKRRKAFHLNVHVSPHALSCRTRCGLHGIVSGHWYWSGCQRYFWKLNNQFLMLL